MKSLAVLPDGDRLYAHCDTIDVTSIGPDYEPDLTWSFTDPAGHVHTHESASRSFHWVYDGEEYWFDEDGEEYNGDGHYECNGCGAEVPSPGTKVVPGSGTGMRSVMPGMRSYGIEHADGTHESLTEDEYEAYVNGFIAQREAA